MVALLEIDFGTKGAPWPQLLVESWSSQIAHQMSIGYDNDKVNHMKIVIGKFELQRSDQDLKCNHFGSKIIKINFNTRVPKLGQRGRRYGKYSLLE